VLAAEKQVGVSPSAQGIPHSRIRELAEIAMRMDGVYKLYFGESNIPTPDFLKKAAQKAMDEGYTFYSSNAGLLSTREAVARYYAQHHNVSLDPNTEIVVTASGVHALNVGIRCMLDPGDEALVMTPAWPNASAIVSMFNARPVELAQKLDGDRYTIDFDALEAALTPRTRMLIYTSPSNPLGWVATEEEQRRLLDFTRRHGLWLMADEVYERLNYLNPNFESFSKSYSMTGWRLGWLVARRDLAARATMLSEFIVSCPNAFVQKAGETALEDGEWFIRESVTQYKANRDLVSDALRTVKGLTLPKPDGAFYLFPKLDGLKDSFEYCKRVLLETKVGLAPGVAFGAGGEGSVRICYAASRDVLEPALERLIPFLQRG
jgi:aspartate/methionine/tyrosine aminotransferase